MNYLAKAKDSFRTKWNLFIYEIVANGMNDFTLNDFIGYSIKKESVDEYTTVYWQERPSFIIRNKSIADIEKTIGKLKKENELIFKEFESHYIKEVFPKLFPIEAFEALIKSNKCVYCGITRDEITELANNKKLRKRI